MNQEKPLEEDITTAILTDLPLGIAQAEEAKAGFGGATLIGTPETAALRNSEKGILIYSGEPG
jgi:hypothetical protein